MGAAKMKGALLRAALAWYEERHGAEARGRLIAGLPDGHPFAPDDAALGVLATEWYAAEHVHAVLDALAEGRSDEEREALAREIAAATVERVRHGVYRFLVRKLVSPGFYARHIQRLWRQVHTTGRREITVDDAARRAVSSTRDWAGHHPLLCLIASHTVAAFFETMGLEGVEVERVACVSAGDDACVAELRWR